MMNKKGQIQSLLPTVMALIMAGILIAIGMVALSGVQDATWDVTTMNVTNETGGYLNNTGYPLANSTLRGFRDANISSIRNATDGVIFATTNYTLRSNMSVYNATAVPAQNGNIVISYIYTYDKDSYASNGTGSAISGIAALASTWLPVIIVVIAAGLVLAILMGALSPSGKRT